MQEKLRDQKALRIWILRHGTPDPKYSEENPLVEEKALAEMDKAAEDITNNMASGETVILGLIGNRARHKRSLQILEQALLKKAAAKQINVKVIESNPTLRALLREAELPENLIVAAEQQGEDIVDLWYHSSETKIIRQRFTALLRGIISYSKSRRTASEENWILVTSGSLPTPLMVDFFGDNPESMGLYPGEWIRVDVPPGKFDGEVKLAHRDGRSVEGKI